MKDKAWLGTDKRSWRPSPLLGQITLVTTVNEDGVSNIAPKSWVSMMAFEPPLLALGCNSTHWTARNILRSGEFVVNVPDAALAPAVWATAALPHPRPVRSAGFTPVPAREVAPPLVEECAAHLECRLERHLAFGAEVIIIGRIVAVVLDREALQADDPYAYLRMPVFLESGTFGVVEMAHHLR